MSKPKIRLTKLTFRGEDPAHVTLTMPIAMAAKLTKHCGSLSPASTVPANSYEATNELHDCLVGMVFNRYWDGGVDDYLAEAAAAGGDT